MCSYLPKVSPDFKLGKALHREGGYPLKLPPPSVASLARPRYYKSHSHFHLLGLAGLRE